MNSFPKSLAGCRCALYGFGGSNRALAKYLIAEGASVSVADKKRTEGEILTEAERDGIKNIAVFKYGSTVNADIVFRTPGISPYSPEITEALRGGAYLGSESELFFARAKGRIYGITGSDGKTTTTRVTGNILKNALKGKRGKVYVGGNIGTPLISFLDLLTEDDITVAEMSSFQLMTAEISPMIAAVTNISENHLDYHKNMQEYIDAKRRIFSGKECRELVTDTGTLSAFKSTEPPFGEKDRFPKVITECFFSGGGDGVSLENGRIYLYGKETLSVSDIRIPGLHNIKNYMTAIGITRHDASAEDVRRTATEFCGAEHRMELVRKVNGVEFFNSSIDSTPSRTVVTLRCFEKPLTVICGGYDKGLSHAELARELLLRADNVVLTGASSGVIGAELERNGACGSGLRIYYEKDLERAALRAADVTPSGGRVLLSPAAASFDAFRNFEERGNVFKNIVNGL